MAAPIVANVALVVTDDMPVVLDSQAAPVVATQGLVQWNPMPLIAGVAPTVSLPTGGMLRLFSQRCSIGPGPADIDQSQQWQPLWPQG